VLCLNSTKAYVESDELFLSNFGAIVISLEHCIEYQEEEQIECAD